LPPCQGMSVWVFITKELPRSFHPGSNSELHKIGDVARFLAAIMNGGEVDGVRILDEAPPGDTTARTTAWPRTCTSMPQLALGSCF
jgi:hypothetical protein